MLTGYGKTVLMGLQENTDREERKMSFSKGGGVLASI